MSNTPNPNKLRFPIIRDGRLNQVLPNNAVGKGPKELTLNRTQAKIIRTDDIYSAKIEVEDDFPLRYEGRMVSAKKKFLALLVFDGESYKMVPIRRKNQYVHFKKVVQVSAEVRDKLYDLEGFTKEEKQEKALAKQKEKEKKKGLDGSDEEKSKKPKPEVEEKSLREILNEKNEAREREKEVERIRSSHARARKRIEEEDMEFENAYDLFEDTKQEDEDKFWPANEEKEDTPESFLQPKPVKEKAKIGKDGKVMKNPRPLAKILEEENSNGNSDESSSSGEDIDMEEEMRHKGHASSVKMFAEKAALAHKARDQSPSYMEVDDTEDILNSDQSNGGSKPTRKGNLNNPNLAFEDLDIGLSDEEL